MNSQFSVSKCYISFYQQCLFILFQIDIVINPNDLHIDTFKSSGPGGQSVQKNDTAVRLTHTPSGKIQYYIIP